MATPKQTDPQFKLRLTPEIKEKIEAAASESGRSMNAEILSRLEDSFVDRQDALMKMAIQIAEARGESRAAFEVVRFISGILARASGHDAETMSLLSNAIRSMQPEHFEGRDGVPSPEHIAAREAVVKRMAEMLRAETKPHASENSDDK